METTQYSILWSLEAGKNVQWVDLHGIMYSGCTVGGASWNYTIQHTLEFRSCSALALASLQINAQNKQLLNETGIVRTHCYL